MTDTAAPPPLPDAWLNPTPEVPPARDADWHHLPSRGTKLAAVGGGFWLGLAGAAAFFVLARISDIGTAWLLGTLGALLGAAFGAWLGVKRHRRTLWKLDDAGFALQRGRWWQTESHGPISRVQHLDLKRGPLERAFKLATLVIHTAGTRMAAVPVSGLDGEDAERLRDRLARQLDHHDDAL